MLRTYESIINECVSNGFQRGIELFVESLNEELIKEDLIVENSNEYLSKLFSPILNNMNK